MMSENNAICVDDLLKHITVPEKGTLSVTLQQDDHVKVVLFAFAAGQELSEHTASVPAIMHQISGKAKWVLAGKEQVADSGTWVWMPAGMPHSITAEDPCVMLLTMLKSAK